MSKHSKEIRTPGFKFNRKSSLTLQSQLYNQLRNMILNGQLRCQDRIPSSRDLANELAISRIIITNVYEQLIDEGYLTAISGSGTFVSKMIPDKLLMTPQKKSFVTNKLKSKINFSDEDTIKKPGNRISTTPFQIGLPSLDSFPYKIWHKCTNHILKEFKTIHLGYDDTFGYWPLRKAIASYLRVSRAVKCEAEQVIIVTGSQQGLNLICMALLNENSSVWMEDPGFYGFKSALQIIGATPNPVPVLKFGVDINYAHKTYGPGDLLYITPSYQFPLGNILSFENRKKLLDYAGKHSMWIVEDDYDSEFRYVGNPLSSLQGLDSYNKVIYSGTFSKVLFPGLRLAYLVLPKEEIVSTFREIKEVIDRQPPILEQAVLTKFIDDGHFLRHIRKMRLLYAQRQQFLIEALNKNCKYYLTFKNSSAGMHLRCRVKKGINIEKFKTNINKSNLSISFVDDFSIKYLYPGEFLLGYTAFTKYQINVGSEVLAECLKQSI